MSLSTLLTAAEALNALDVLAEAATGIDIQAEAALLQALPQPSVLGPNTGSNKPVQPILREIRDDIWESGEYYLHENPNVNEILVHFHHWTESMRWEFKIVRVSGGFQRQTWLNGVLMG